MDKPIVSDNKNVDVYYQTTDGSCFFTNCAAIVHAKMLKDNTVVTVHKNPILANSEKVIPAVAVHKK